LCFQILASNKLKKKKAINFASLWKNKFHHLTKFHLKKEDSDHFQIQKFEQNFASKKEGNFDHFQIQCADSAHVACSSLLGFGMSFQNLGLATLVGCSFWRQLKTKKGPPHVCQGNDFDLYVVVVLVGFVCCCCSSSSSWILFVVVVVVALWCSKSPYNERGWQTATTAMAPGKFYAVRCGYTPGIYDTWVACQQQVVLPKINLPPNLAPTQVFFFWVGGVAFSMNRES